MNFFHKYMLFWKYFLIQSILLYSQYSSQKQLFFFSFNVVSYKKWKIIFKSFIIKYIHILDKPYVHSRVSLNFVSSCRGNRLCILCYFSHCSFLSSWTFVLFICLLIDLIINYSENMILFQNLFKIIKYCYISNWEQFRKFTKLNNWAMFLNNYSQHSYSISKNNLNFKYIRTFNSLLVIIGLDPCQY